MKDPKENGFTIIEILIAITISSLLAAGIYSVYRNQINTRKIHEQTVEVQQNIRSAMYMMDRDIRMAGYRGTVVNANPGFIDTSSEQALTFTYIAESDGYDNDGDSYIDESDERLTVSYFFSDTDSDGINDAIIRTVGSDTTIIARNIENLEFYYTEANVSTLAPVNLNQITSVKISIRARSRLPVPGGGANRMYETPSGAKWGGDGNDGFIHRFETSHVTCRNLL